ncbi:MAG: hypothetical protein M1820_010843 [Bogoriella megaspora]|nr:MAG: hypothetical protein M1820_010843 [Bogoriella megaspora]
MPQKRKRDLDGGHNQRADPTERARQASERRLAAHEKLIARTLKVAKVYERPKLAKRLKAAKSTNDVSLIKRLEKEVEALNDLEPHAIAANHLRKSLLKINFAAAPASLPFRREDVQPLSKDTAALNVVARLYRATKVKEATDFAIAQIKQTMGIEDKGQAKPHLPSRSSTENSSVEKTNMEFSESDDNGFAAKMQSTDKSSIGKPPNGRLPLQNRDDEDAEDAEDSEEDLVGMATRVASSSDEEMESGEDEIKKSPPQAGLNSRYNPANDFSLSPSNSELSASSPPDPAKGRSKHEPAKPPTNSTFIPSLTLGGYISGSDSEVEDIDVQPQRRNRRGQRARQLIWEQKYGNRANHLQKSGREKEKKGDRNKGWDSKRGAVEEKDKRYSNAKGSYKQNKSGPTDANAIEINEKKETSKYNQDNEGPLHPSWQAKNAMKQKQEQIPAFQGKKITFD